MSGIRLFKLSLLGMALVLDLAGSAAGSQAPDSAPYYSALKSFNSNGEAFVADFRNGIRVIIEESYGIPLAAVNAVITLSDGPGSREVLSAAAESCAREIEPGILAVGGMVDASPGPGCIILKMVVPAEETAAVFEILGKFQPSWQAIPGRADFESVRKSAEDSVGSDFSGLLRFSLESIGKEAEKHSAQPALSSPGRGSISALVAAGSVQHEKLLEQIARYFPADREVSHLPMPGRTTEAASVEMNHSIDYENFATDLEFPVFTISFRIPSPGQARRTEVEILERIIGGGLAGLLRSDEENLALSFQYRSEIVDLDSVSYLVLSTAVRPDNFDRVEMMMLGTLSLLGQRELPASLVNRGKSLALLDRFRELDSLPSRADGWTGRLLLGNTVPDRGSSVQMISGIEAKALMAACSAFLHPDRAFVREFIPSGMKRSFNSETFRETLQILLPQSEAAAAKRLERYGYSELQSGFSVPEIPANVIPPELKKSSVLRGPDIHVYEQHNAPLVRLGVFYPGGDSSGDQNSAEMNRILVSSMLQHWSLNGLDPRIVALEGSGCLVEGVVNPDYSGFRATMLSPSFEWAFSELVKMIKAFPAEDSLPERMKYVRQFSAYLNNQADPESMLAELSPGPGTAMIRSGEASEKGTSPTLSGFFQYLSGIHPDIVIAGDVKGTSFLRGMVPILSNSGLSKLPKPTRRNRGTSKIKPLPVVLSGGYRCSLITSGLPGNSGREESLRIISSSLDGSGTSLDWIILVRNGYGIFSSKSDFEGKCDILPALRNLGARKFGEREFNQAKVRAITSFYLETERPEELLNSIIIRLLSGEEGDFIRQLLVDLKQVRVVEVESVLENLFGELQQ